ncbi:unnamed protein product [Amoebophrya sp. A120]|nr:unnamed protein product [Amoebophrya sp. A120]|eukprot:GSA120T00003100001.1
MDPREKIKAANRARMARMESQMKGPSMWSRAVTGLRNANKTAQLKYLTTIEGFRKQQLENAMSVDADGGVKYQKSAATISSAPTQEQVEEHRKDIARKQKEKVTNQVFMEYCRKQVILREDCLTLPFTLFLWITFLLVVIVHSNIQAVYLTRRGVVDDLERIEVIRSPNETASPLTIHDLETREDVNDWLQDGFLPRINGSVVKVYNRIAGSVVLSQSRAKKTSCDVDAGLRKFYDAHCFPPDQPLDTSFPGLGPEFVHKAGGLANAEEFRYYAFLNFWDQNNPSVMSLPNTVSAEKVRLQQHAYLTTLVQREWIDSASIDLMIRFLAFNPETKVYLNTKIEFEFHRGGWVETTLSVHAETSDLYENGLAIVYDVIWVVLVCTLMYVEIKQMKLVQATIDLLGGKAFSWGYWSYLREYWSDFWNFIDWLSVGMGFAFVFEIMALQSNLKDLAGMFSEIGPQAIQRAVGTGQFGSVGTGLTPYYDSNLELFALSDDIEARRKMVQLLGFFYSMLIIMRFFKGFRGQPRIAIMGLSLVNASYDMLHFLIVFFLVYVNYSMGGWILFGSQLEEWNTLLKAMGVTLKIVYGDFDYDKIYRITPLIASLWFFSFIIILVFLVLNLLTALVYDKYMGVLHHTNFRGAHTIFQQVKDIFTDTLMSQSQSTDAMSGKRRQINYEVIYDRLKEFVDRDEFYSEEQKIREENEALEEQGLDPIPNDVRQVRLKMARARSDSAETSWAVTNLETSFQGDFANGMIERDFLIDRCGLDGPQALYLMAKCIQQSLDDAKNLEPEQFLKYTMKFEFADLTEQLQEIRRMLYTLQEHVMGKQDRLREVNTTVKDNVRDLEPFLDEEWTFVPGMSGNILYHNKDTDEVTADKPMLVKLMDAPAREAILEKRRKQQLAGIPEAIADGSLGEQQGEASASLPAIAAPSPVDAEAAAVAEIEAAVDAANVADKKEED